MKDTSMIITEGYPKWMKCASDSLSTPVEAFVICEHLGADRKYKGFKVGETCVLAFQFAEDIVPEKPRTIADGLRQGDIIAHGQARVKILGVCGEAIFKSLFDFRRASSIINTLDDIIECGWKLESETTPEPEIVELTIEDISKGIGAGVDPKFIRIKDMVRIKD